MNTEQCINEGKTTLGIELGSTRIKAVLINDNFSLIASGSYDWENRLEGGVWTYNLDDVWKGLEASFRNLAGEVQKQYCVKLSSVGAIGISAMMHGYLAFDSENKQLVPFRTWRNTITAKAAEELTGKFNFSIPQRWSIAHLYQAILNREDHVKDIAFITTLAGYVHWKLTGQKVIGINDASGMFPVDSTINDYNKRMLEQFTGLVKPLGFGWNISGILPKALCAGENAGTLSLEGAKLLDPSLCLKPGIPFCPPEGDAGTGMVATNSVAKRTGNISAGTSIFAMIVLEKELSKLYPEIDMVTTPAGKPVAMVHCNNCSTDLDAWIKLFMELADLTGSKMDKSAFYEALYKIALDGEEDCSGLLSYNYHAGEHLTGFEQGRPLFVRTPNSNFTLANFMRTQLYSSISTLKLGMEILTAKEQVSIDGLMGHGGFFKTKDVGQRIMAGALNTAVSVMESAGEGGAWGIAILAAYSLRKKDSGSLEQFLSDKVFNQKTGSTIKPEPKDVEGFKKYMERYKAGLKIERAAVENS